VILGEDPHALSTRGQTIVVAVVVAAVGVIGVILVKGVGVSAVGVGVCIVGVGVSIIGLVCSKKILHIYVGCSYIGWYVLYYTPFFSSALETRKVTAKKTVQKSDQIF